MSTAADTAKRAAEAKKAAEAAAKDAEKAAKAAVKEAEKAAKQAAKEEKKATKDKEKEEKKAAKDKEKADKKAAKEAAKKTEGGKEITEKKKKSTEDKVVLGEQKTADTLGAPVEIVYRAPNLTIRTAQCAFEVALGAPESADEVVKLRQWAANGTGTARATFAAHCKESTPMALTTKGGKLYVNFGGSTGPSSSGKAYGQFTVGWAALSDAARTQLASM